MAVQVSYPGVYIDEFAPGAPIQGVGTNTAAFVGLDSVLAARDEADGYSLTVAEPHRALPALL